MKRFLKNTTFSLMGKIVGMAAIMILDIFLARSLKVENYAEWVFFFSVTTILFFIGWLGINASVKVGISKCENVIDRTRFIQVAFMLRFITSIIISVVIAVVMSHYCYFLGYPNKYQNLKLLFWLSGFLVFFNSFTEFYKEMMMGMNEFKMLFVITVIEYMGYLVFSVASLSISKKVVMIALAYCLSGIVVFLVGMAFLQKQFGFFAGIFNDIKIKSDTAKEIIKYAIPLLLVGVGVVVVIEIDTFMLGVLSEKSEVAIYNIAKSISSKAAHINYSIAVGAMTSFSLVFHNEYLKKRKRFLVISELNILVTTMVSLVMYFFAQSLIVCFYGEAYSAAGNVAKKLIPYYVLYSLSTFYSVFLDFRGKARIRGIAYCSIIVFDILFNYLLIPRYGALGAAIATSISLLPYTLLVMVVSEREWKTIKEKGDLESGKSMA